MMRQLLLAMVLMPISCFAQDRSPNTSSAMPRCDEARDGQTLCRFGVIYECQFVSPNSMERRTGWRWKSDILRGCDTAATAADLPGGNQDSVPPGFTYAPQITPYGTQSGQAGVKATPGARPYGRSD